MILLILYQEYFINAKKHLELECITVLGQYFFFMKPYIIALKINLYMYIMQASMFEYF